MFYFVDDTATRDPWNKGKLMGQKKPLKMNEAVPFSRWPMTPASGFGPLRRTKASLIYRRTKNLWYVQLLIGHARLESTLRH